MELSLFEAQARPPRRTLVAVDLGEYSEKIISYLFIITRDILSEFTVFHRLEGTTTENEARQKIEQILQATQRYLNPNVGSKIKIHITSNELIAELQYLNTKENFGSIVIGTNNNAHSNQMGHNAKAILMSLSAGIIAVPPEVELAFPSNVCFLVEKIEPRYFSYFNTLHDFVSHYGMFLTFILFAKDAKELEEEKKLIEEYQELFDSTITFSFIVEQEQSYDNFLKYIDGIHSDSAVIMWNENAVAYKAAKESGFVACSARLPLLYIKRDDPQRQ